MAETRRTSPGAGKFAGSGDLAPGAGSSPAPAGEAGQATLRNLIGAMVTRHADPLASGARTSKTLGSVSPLTNKAWGAGTITPRAITPTESTGGASRLSALSRVMGTSYGKPGAGVSAPATNNSTSGIPDWLQNQIADLQAQQNSYAEEKKAAPTGGGVPVQVVNPLDQLKARVLQQDLARQQALMQDAVWNAQREKALSTTTGMNQFIQNRAVAPAATGGGWAGSSPFSPMTFPTAQQQQLANPYLSPYSYDTQPSTVVRPSSTGLQYLKAPPPVVPSLPMIW